MPGRKKRVDAQLVEAMTNGLLSITARLDQLKLNGDGQTFNLPLSPDEVDALHVLREQILALQPVLEIPADDQHELELVVG